jgi:3'-phosphoadenosine 5'-phosphosulfate sulfotransferase (PAPS reductase)/FAD synthetase
MMAIKLREWFPDHEIINVMANTSKEHPESLSFMDKCDKHYNLNLVWLEGEFHEKGVGTTPKVVRYEDLRRNGEIFEEGIKKYGIPSQVNKWCNRDMKLIPLTKYADTIFGKNNYSVAVGIRIDEVDRMRKDYKENNIFYPLIDHNISKKDRNKFWLEQPIKINIPAFKGNCDLCFEKSNRKLMTILKEDEGSGKWWMDMINTYGHIELDGKDSYNDLLREHGGTFFRGYNTIDDLIELAKQPFSKATDEYIYENDLFDLEGDCGAGCVVF